MAKLAPNAPVPEGFFLAPNGRLVANKFKGAKKYRTTEVAYLDGRLVPPGEVVVLVDCTPSTTFEPLEAAAAAPAPAPKSTDKRASDKSV